MDVTSLLLTTISAIIILLLLVLIFRVHAFVSLLLVSIYVGLITGMPLSQIYESVEKGMGGILGFVAVIVGVGSIFGQILESSGGAEQMAKRIVSTFGIEKSEWALSIIGFMIAIPIFLDVGFIILVPIIYSLSRSTGKSTLLFAIPLLAGLAVTHSFIPPTPGPVAVANILNAPLGYVILFGAIVGIPCTIIAGPLFGRYIGKKIYLAPPKIEVSKTQNYGKQFSLFIILFSILLPLILIVLRTLLELLQNSGYYSPEWVAGFFGFENMRYALAIMKVVDVIVFLGHPFSALIIATFYAAYFLGIRGGFNKAQLLDMANKALGPAGIIILVTGAGGVFKQVLVDSGVGKSLAELMTTMPVSPLVLAYLLAVIIRITQGSATVAMITSAGMIAPILEIAGTSDVYNALVVISIASGATILSHVNDSGFWLIGKYLGMTEKQTLRSWTVMETIISISGFILTLLLSILVI